MKLSQRASSARLFKWRNPKSFKTGKAHMEDSENESLLNSGAPLQVPKGFLAVNVGPEERRFVIPMSFLSKPEFRVLMDNMAEEFGFEQERGLHIPSEEDEFEEILYKCLRLTSSSSKIKNKILK